MYFGLELMSSGNDDMAIGTGLEHIKYLVIDVKHSRFEILVADY